MTITNYTDLELRLQAEVAELKARWKQFEEYDCDELKAAYALVDELKAEHIAYIGRTGARILALRWELGQLKAENENLRAYAKHERSLGAEPFAMENLDLAQQVEILKAKLAEFEKPRKSTVIDESALILEEGRYHKWDDENGEDWEWFQSGVECDTCIDVLLVRKDKFQELQAELAELKARLFEMQNAAIGELRLDARRYQFVKASKYHGVCVWEDDGYGCGDWYTIDEKQLDAAMEDGAVFLAGGTGTEKALRGIKVSRSQNGEAFFEPTTLILKGTP